MPPSAKAISFAEFANRKETQKEMSKIMRRSFEFHVREQLGNFNYRTEQEWDQVYRNFLAADRRRRNVP